jgi:hypothetical protein
MELVSWGFVFRCDPIESLVLYAIPRFVFLKMRVMRLLFLCLWDSVVRIFWGGKIIYFYSECIVVEDVVYYVEFFGFGIFV